MKLNPEFLIHHTDSESILVPTGKTGFSGVVRGNKTFGAILELLKNDTSEDEIIAAMKTRFSGSEGKVEKDVEKALAELRKIGAIRE